MYDNWPPLSASWKILASLTGHLSILASRLELFIVLLIALLSRMLLGSLGKVNLGSAGAATALDDVVQVDLAKLVVCNDVSIN